jgi:Protein of unknown function (DUF3887)
MTHDVPPERGDQARALFGDLIAGRWEKAHQGLNVTMRAYADPGRIARGWTRVADRAGNFERMGVLSARQSGDYTVMDVPLTFEAGKAIGRVVLNRDGKVAGLSLAYPHRRRLDPRPVQGFVLRSPEVAEFFSRF